MRRSVFLSVHLAVAFTLFAIFLVVSTFVFGIIHFLSYLVPIGKRRREGIMYFCMIVNARLAQLLSGVRTEASGFDSCRAAVKRMNGKTLLVANHTSMLDVPVILSNCYPARVGFLAKKSLFKIPLLNLYLKVSKSVPIDVKSVKSNIEAIRRGADNLMKGIPMLVFPEGTRSKSGAIAPFKRGSFKMALRSGSAVIPIALCGLRQFAEGRKRIFVKAHAQARAMDLVDFSSLGAGEADRAVTDIENAIRTIVQNYG